MTDDAHPVDMKSVRTTATLARAAFVTAVASNVGFAFGIMGPSLRSGLGLSHAGLGLLTSVFFACTGAASIAAGHIVARSGNRATAVGALGATCIGCVAAAWVGTYAALVVAAVFAGAGYSVVNVVTNRLVRSASTRTSWAGSWPSRRRAFPWPRHSSRSSAA